MNDYEAAPGRPVDRLRLRLKLFLLTRRARREMGKTTINEELQFRNPGVGRSPGSGTRGRASGRPRAYHRGGRDKVCAEVVQARVIARFALVERYHRLPIILRDLYDFSSLKTNRAEERREALPFGRLTLE